MEALEIGARLQRFLFWVGHPVNGRIRAPLTGRAAGEYGGFFCAFAGSHDACRAALATNRSVPYDPLHCVNALVHYEAPIARPGDPG